MKCFGWLPDIPDVRDCDVKHEKVKPFVLKETPLVSSCMVPKVPAVINQFSMQSCTAHSAFYEIKIAVMMAGLDETPHDPARRFIYYTSRKLAGIAGDNGSYNRSTLKALALFGAPPETEWKYDLERFDDEPTPFVYSMAKEFAPLVYYRLDPFGKPMDKVLDSIKLNIQGGRGCILGFSVYDSIEQGNKTGKIPFPRKGDRLLGGHSICVCGYDDKMMIDGHEGALIHPGSWGTNCGADGFWFLPYDFVRFRLAQDVWVINSMKWIDIDQFAA